MIVTSTDMVVSPKKRTRRRKLSDVGGGHPANERLPVTRCGAVREDFACHEGGGQRGRPVKT